MRLKDWSFLGNYEFFTNRLQMLATNDLPAEKWSYAGKEDFGILRNYLYFTFEKLWKEREEAPEDYMIRHGSQFTFIALKIR